MVKMEKWWKSSLDEISDKKKNFPIVDGPFGTQLHADEYVTDGIPLIRVINLSYSGKFNEENLAFITEEKFTKLRRSEVEPDDIIVAKTGATIGKCGLLPRKFKKGIIASSCLKISTDKEKACPKYLLYLIASPEGQKKILDGASGSTRTTINITPCKKIEFSFPPVKEQQEISKIIQAIDSSIDETKERIEKNKKIKQGLVYDLFTKGVDENGKPHRKLKNVEEYGEIPLNWKTSTLGNECDDICRYPTYYGIEYVSNGVREIRGKLILDNGRINTDSNVQRFISQKTSLQFPRTILKEGDFVISVRGTMGKIGYIDKQLEG